MKTIINSLNYTKYKKSIPQSFSSLSRDEITFQPFEGDFYKLTNSLIFKSSLKCNIPNNIFHVKNQQNELWQTAWYD